MLNNILYVIKYEDIIRYIYSRVNIQYCMSMMNDSE